MEKLTKEEKEELKAEYLEMIKEHEKICFDNAKKYNKTENQARKCDEVNKPLCLICPFIMK